MSETLQPMVTTVDQQQLAEQLLAEAKGIELVGRNGLLRQLTKNVLDTALDAEMTEHLGYDKHDPVGRVSGSNSRNGTRPKTVFTEIGPVEIEVLATTPCASASKSPTAANANSPTRTAGYAANSRAPLANSAPTPGDTRR